MRIFMNTTTSFNLQNYTFVLPEERIARFPRKNRSDARLLYVKENSIQNRNIVDLVDLLQSGDRLVVNNTKVMKARIHTKRKTGGSVEVFVTKVHDNRHCSALIRPSRRIKEGEQFILDREHTITCLRRNDVDWTLHCTPSVSSIMDSFGSIPIPPYFKREANEQDEERYQSIFADEEGAVAASTACLHIDQTLQARLIEKGVGISAITLHIGTGTFAPLRQEQIETQKLHKEWFSISEQTVQDILETKNNGGRIIAVGTTVTRCLESVAKKGSFIAQSGETDLFIQEGFSFQVIDGLLTNFHLPQSSLLMLVCAFGGRKNILDAYHHAIQEEYNFYSYGDAMLVIPDQHL
ncbi:MAG: tRNA preQ1(34) S-adenosylmethionine ribosyltransferase-isomerase QueA [Deltaproteobacteria bacterium]|nr:tRNA preQ1(34) S-adenosylmethionine ribosyltransferase-isomerase QueA [Deltaproteobacteria bacterium]